MIHFYKLLQSSFFLAFKIAFLVILTLPAFSQVGFNNPDPDSTSLIDMKSNEKGLLIPRMTTADRERMALPGKKPANALMVFDIDKQMFFFYDTTGSRWISMNPWQSEANDGSSVSTSVNGNVGIGTDTPTEKLEVNGKVKAIEFTGNGTIPVGGIIMWSGSVANIPEGWAICDGTNGTPDLRGRFIVGYDNADPDYNSVRKTGPAFTDADGISTGVNTQDAKAVRLTAGQSGLPGHSHTGNTSTNGEHTHTVNEGGDHLLDNVPNHLVGTSHADYRTGPYSINMTPAGNHSHTLNINTNTALPASQPVENRPPYYVVAFLMRVN